MAPNPAKNLPPVSGRGLAGQSRAQLTAQIIGDALRYVRNGEGRQAAACLNAQGGLALDDDFACNLLGLVHASLGEDEMAVTAFDRSLALRPGNIDVVGNRALILQRLGRLDAAIFAYDEVLRARPEDAQTHYNRATASHLLGRTEEAVAAYDRALRIRPGYREALTGRGLALAELGRREEALIFYDEALRLDARDAITHYNRGDLLRGLGRDDEALEAYRDALSLRPDHADALCGCAIILGRRERLEEALACCAKALSHAPDHFAARFNEANLLYAAGRIAEACADFDAAARLCPDDPDVLSNRAAALLEQGRLHHALASCEAALHLRPLFPEALSNRGNILQKLHRFEEALASYEAAIALRADYVEAWCGRGVALKELGSFDDALASFDEALQIESAHAHTLNNRGALLLLLGDFERGFEGYESRWLKENLPVTALPRVFPEWRGEALDGKRILVLDEQGLGDVIQLCRYLPELGKAGAEVTFICRKSLHRLIGSIAGNVRIVDAPVAGESFDYETPLASLPRAFKAGHDRILAPIPYLRAEGALIREWASRIGRQGLRVGIAWQGSPNIKADTARAVPLRFFAPLARIADVRLVSLQKHAGAEQLEAGGPGFPVEALGKAYDCGADAFIDAAAVIANLDLVITCDTSIAHLAGALGKPVWVALKSVPDWRWMLEREDTPWYPQMRLFRQARRGEWDEVFARMARELEALASARRTRSAAAILIPGAVGELVDKITILEIKAERIADPAKLRNVTHELTLLRGICDEGGFHGGELDALSAELKAINVALWEIEDEIRLCEARGDFGERFIALARSVYKTNDRRAAVKREINTLCGSVIVEEKSYAG